MTVLTRIKAFIESRLRRLDADEHGSAMTEFVIGLPVFVIIFGGTLMLYDINNEALRLKAQANSDLWSKADPGAGAIIPIGAGLSVLSADDFADVAQNGASVLGIYADSYVKTKIPLSVPGSGNVSPCFDIGCALPGSTPDFFGSILLNDNMVNGTLEGNLSASGWANAISSALTVTGSRPAFVAGIRYGAVEGDSQTATVGTPMFGDIDIETGNLDVPAVTQPTHRSLAVLVTRIEFAREDFWNKQVPEFDSDFDTASSSVDTSGQGECTTAVQNYNTCMSGGPTGETQGEAEERCESEAPGGACDSLGSSNPLPSVNGSFSP